MALNKKDEFTIIKTDEQYFYMVNSIMEYYDKIKKCVRDYIDPEFIATLQSELLSKIPIEFLKTFNSYCDVKHMDLDEEICELVMPVNCETVKLMYTYDIVQSIFEAQRPAPTASALTEEDRMIRRMEEEIEQIEFIQQHEMYFGDESSDSDE